MVMGGNQLYLRRQQTGIGGSSRSGWLIVRRKDVDGRPTTPAEIKGDDNLGLGVIVIFLLVISLPLLLQ